MARHSAAIATLKQAAATNAAAAAAAAAAGSGYDGFVLEAVEAAVAEAEAAELETEMDDDEEGEEGEEGEEDEEDEEDEEGEGVQLAPSREQLLEQVKACPICTSTHSPRLTPSRTPHPPHSHFHSYPAHSHPQ